MRLKHGLAAICVALSVDAAVAQDRRVTLAAPAELAADGFLKYVLPRFSLKTGIRVAPVGFDEGGDVLLGPAVADGRPAFERAGVLYRVAAPNGEFARRFADWLVSDVGRRTVEAFAAEGAPRYRAATAEDAARGETGIAGNVAAGMRLSYARCGRCHVVGPKNRMKGLGSTPSFAVLRTLDDWEDRFHAFYALNPHPSFTQVENVTEPFDEARPPPIVPLRITLADLEAIVAYVATVRPAELAAPLVQPRAHQQSSPR